MRLADETRVITRYENTGNFIPGTNLIHCRKNTGPVKVAIYQCDHCGVITDFEVYGNLKEPSEDFYCSNCGHEISIQPQQN